MENIKKFFFHKIDLFDFFLFGSFEHFSSSKIDFWSFLKWQKMKFGQIFFREIYLFDFTSFFGLDFFKFSGPLCHDDLPIHGFIFISKKNTKLWLVFVLTHRGPEYLKKFRPKKLVKSNKSIPQIFFGQIPFFAISKLAKNQFLN